MRPSSVRPTGVERLFDDDEIIVSKTDTRGVITYANDVFLRISGYPEEELIGRPHNLIRHPDMPRCVFRLLWDTLHDGRELFAYVLNLAKDGCHYWVLAHVTPTRDGSGRIVGYHSNRRTVAKQAIDVVRPLYGELLAEEARHSDPARAVDAGSQLLHAKLDGLGMAYDEFVWSLDPAANVGVAA